MIEPTVLYYAKLKYDPTSKKTPKYVIVEAWGEYEPMKALVGRDGRVSMYLMPKRDNQPTSTPSMRLQAKKSLNFTGLKDYFVDGKLSGFAYGYPLQEQTFSKEATPNPFYERKSDAFLFLVHQDANAITAEEQLRPSYIELIVLDGAKVMVSSYCKQLMMGGFDEILKVLRNDAKSISL